MWSVDVGGGSDGLRLSSLRLLFPRKFTEGNGLGYLGLKVGSGLGGADTSSTVDARDLLVAAPGRARPAARREGPTPSLVAQQNGGNRWQEHSKDDFEG
jgi:hypothetical protein